MKWFGLSAFLTITALSVAGLLSQSAAQPGPSATPPPAAPAPEGPCQQIMAVCRQAGFVQGGAKTGVGLVVDCVRPIVQGTAQRPKASKPLPQVDPQIAAACKAINPNLAKANRQPKTQQRLPQ